MLKEAYELANTFDQERIDFLELEGLEESSVEIYQLYEQMNYRQNKVRRLPSQIRNQFTFVNYDQMIVDSKPMQPMYRIDGVRSFWQEEISLVQDRRLQSSNRQT